MQAAALSAEWSCPACAAKFVAFGVGAAEIPVVNGDAAFSDRLATEVATLFADPRHLLGWLEGDDELRHSLAGGLTTYAQAHFGEFAEPALPGAELSWLQGWLPADLPAGDVALLGCGPGGELLALAKAIEPGRTVWLADANLAALVWGRLLAELGAVPLPYRASATRLGWATARLSESQRNILQRAHWLCCDALRPPWPAGSMAAVVSVGLVDSVADPIALIQQVEGLLAPGGVWLLAAPWNWQAAVTPPNRQLERFIPGDDLDAGLADLLTGAVIPGLGAALHVERRAPRIPWRLPVHGRMTVEYELDVLLLRKAR